MSEQLIQTPGVFGDNGNFLLERELGAGGMGGVYMGRDKMLDRFTRPGEFLHFVENYKGVSFDKPSMGYALEIQKESVEIVEIFVEDSFQL